MRISKTSFNKFSETNVSTTLSIMIFRIMTLNIIGHDTQHNEI
jgi:hypothetical protein